MLLTSFDLDKVLTYLEPYLMANVLASEWQPMASKNYPYIVNMEEATLLGMELFRRFGFDPAPKTGVCKVVYAHRTAVIKIPIHESYQAITDMEIADINTRWPEPKHQRYFPVTLDVGDGVAVQERCRTMSEDEYEKYRVEVTMLAMELGLWDYHDGNVGFSLYENELKFFDVQQKEHLRMLGEIQSTARRWALEHNGLDNSGFKGDIDDGESLNHGPFNPKR